MVTRGNVPVAEIRPAVRRTGRDLRAALAATEPPDEDFAASITEAVALLTIEEDDPWLGE